MPYRAYHLALGIGGVLTVALLLIFGANPEAQSQTGPRWKQRLLAAGLLLLAAVGMGPACSNGGTQKSTSSSAMSTGPTDSATQSTARPRATAGASSMAGNQGMAPAKAVGHHTDLARSTEWAQISKVTAKAEAIAAGKRGSYPFNHVGRAHLLAALKKAQENADALAKRQLITAPEAGLLKQDLITLVGKVSAFRATEMRNSTCYKPMAMIAPATYSLKRLQARLPLLQKLAAAKSLHPRVLKKVLAKVEADVVVLEDPAKRKRLAQAERAKAKKIAATARAQLAKIKTLLTQTTRKKGK